MTNNLSRFFCFISKFYIFSCIKASIIGFAEAYLNTLTFFFRKSRYTFKHVENKLAVITGGTRGVGKEIVEILVQHGYTVHILARDVPAMARLQDLYGKNKLKYSQLDLSNPSEIPKKVDEIFKDARIDLLINNAGVYYKTLQEKHGVEIDFLINHVGHYVLTKSLLKNIKGRIVNVSSSVMYTVDDFQPVMNYDLLMDNYGRSKLANALHSLCLKKEGFDSVCVHPGIIPTDLFDNTYYGFFVRIMFFFIPFIFFSPYDGASSVVHAATTNDVDENPNKMDFYMRMEKGRVPVYCTLSNAIKLERYSEKICSKLGVIYKVNDKKNNAEN